MRCLAAFFYDFRGDSRFSPVIGEFLDFMIARVVLLAHRVVYYIRAAARAYTWG